MSDTVSSTAPIGSGSESALIEAGARRLAALSTAAPATSDPQAIPEAQAPTAAAAQSEDQQPQDTGEPHPEQQEPGDTEAEKPPPQPVDPDTVVFTMDGTPITAREAEQGYLRQQDYSKKQQLVAQGRDVLIQRLQETSTNLEVAAKVIEARLPQVNDQLRHEDPGQWAAQVMERNTALQDVARLRAESQVARDRIEEASAEDIQASMQRALPHWRDEEVARKEQKLARDYVADLGWPEASIERARRDPYVIAAVLEAAKHRSVVKGAAKGGAATAAARLQPSPSIAQAQVRPPPVGTAAARQQQAQTRSGEAVRTQPRPNAGLRERIDLGAARLARLPAR